MELYITIQEKFINEVANTLIDSLDDYSEYIEENQDLEYFTELSDMHLIGYYECEMFLTNERDLSGFGIVGSYVADYENIFGELPNKDYYNTESIYQFYLDTFLSQLVYSIDMDKEIIPQIENWRAEQIKELIKF